MPQDSPQYQVRALERALDLLESFTLAEPELSFTELTERSGLSKATAVRLLSILERRRFLERSPDTDRYHIGLRTFELGSIYAQSSQLETVALPFLKELADTCGQSANLGILDQGQVVHVVVVPASRPIHFSVRSGQRDAAHSSGLGKVLLAALPDAELDEIITARGLEQRTPKTLITLDTLRAALVEVRAQGYAIDDEESVPGLTCIAAPVFDDRGRVVGAVSISGLTSEYAEPNRSTYIAAVVRAANGISQRLGAAVQAGRAMDETNDGLAQAAAR
ncbi:MAG TPA: IclR family transcriptional regulator [Thermomicrobiales bacterium]|nr:IclR family transcriptional regulator [Thermomicrobiales bacterium]